MSRVTSYKITNRDQSSGRTDTMYDLEEATSYVVRGTSNGDEVHVNARNKTVNSDQHGEVIEYWYREVSSMQSSPLWKYTNTPATGFQNYGLSVNIMAISEDIDSNCCSLDTEIREPVRVTIAVQHPDSPYITDAMIDEAIDRARSGLKNENGTSKIGSMRRGSINPKEN